MYCTRGGICRLLLQLRVVGEGGGRAIAEALRVNTTLTELNLGSNDLGDGAGRAIAEALRVNTMLTSLELGGNRLGKDEGLRAIVETLRVNHAHFALP
jgi:Ran GTPase-activating protein (RanGAP) involved in mRNA processing and transport